MSTISNLWAKFKKSRSYRQSFVGAYLKRSIPFQIVAMRKARNWSQQRLAKAAGVTQGVISRAEDPNYGNLTLNTMIKIASGFDAAFEARFVPFSELAKTAEMLSEESAQVASFNADVEPLKSGVSVPIPRASTGLEQTFGTAHDVFTFLLARNFVNAGRTHLPVDLEAKLACHRIGRLEPIRVGEISQQPTTIFLPLVREVPVVGDQQATNSSVTGSLTNVPRELRAA